MGMYPESFLEDGNTGISLPDEDTLTVSEKILISSIRRYILSQYEWGIWDSMRVFVVFLGLCLLTYAVLSGVAYFFDRSNNLFEVSMISILSLRALSFSDDEDEDNWRCVNKRRLIKTEILLFLTGFLLVSEGIFNFILNIYFSSFNVG